MIILWDADQNAAENYRLALGSDALTLDSATAVGRAIHENPGVRQVVIGAGVPLGLACELADAARLDRPEIGVILLRTRLDVSTLSQALRCGVREVVDAGDQASLAEALRRSEDLTSRLSGGRVDSGQHEGNIVTVFSAKGGVGKTTLATNLGTHLAAAGKHTVLVDLDLSFGDVAISLQLMPTRSIHDGVAMGGHLDEQGLASLVARHEDSGLDVICSPTNPADADRIPSQVVAELLRVARRHYEYVIVDTPPAFTEHVLAAVDLSAALVLMATLDIPAVKNLKVALETLDALGSPKDARIIVLNRSDAKVGLRPADVTSAIHADIAVSIPNSIAVPAAVNRGVPIVQDDPKSPVSQAIRELADSHIRPRFGEVPSQNGHPRRRGLFGGS